MLETSVHLLTFLLQLLNFSLYCGSQHTSNFDFKALSKSKISSWKIPYSYSCVIKCDYPQNADFPRYYSKKEKKPFPVPIVELRRAARERMKKSKGQPRKPVPPPKNGLLVKSMIPVAHGVFNSRITLINNLKKLLKVVPVHACG